MGLICMSLSIGDRTFIFGLYILMYVLIIIVKPLSNWETMLRLYKYHNMVIRLKD